ncbi:AAA family ATPase [Actinoplanes sp. CA-131856]
MRYVLTGAPGSGKTALLRQLEIAGYAVVEEAATDVIALRQALGVAEPWREPGFIDHIVDLQRRRQLAAPDRGIVFFDRSPVCTLALSRYAGRAPSPLLLAEIERTEHLYARTVFFVRHQGFVQPTAARRISFEDALRFERIHEETYREVGFTVVEVPAAPLETRTAVIRDRLGPGR